MLGRIQKEGEEEEDEEEKEEDGKEDKKKKQGKRKITSFAWSRILLYELVSYAVMHMNFFPRDTIAIFQDTFSIPISNGHLNYSSVDFHATVEIDFFVERGQCKNVNIGVFRTFTSLIWCPSSESSSKKRLKRADNSSVCFNSSIPTLNPLSPHKVVVRPTFNVGIEKKITIFHFGALGSPLPFGVNQDPHDRHQTHDYDDAV